MSTGAAEGTLPRDPILERLGSGGALVSHRALFLPNVTTWAPSVNPFPRLKSGNGDVTLRIVIEGDSELLGPDNSNPPPCGLPLAHLVRGTELGQHREDPGLQALPARGAGTSLVPSTPGHTPRPPSPILLPAVEPTPFHLAWFPFPERRSLPPGHDPRRRRNRVQEPSLPSAPLTSALRPCGGAVHSNVGEHERSSIHPLIQHVTGLARGASALSEALP